MSLPCIDLINRAATYYRMGQRAKMRGSAEPGIEYLIFDCDKSWWQEGFESGTSLITEEECYGRQCS